MLSGGEARRDIRVIIVEDNRDDVVLLLRELQRGYKVHHAHVETAEELRAAFEREAWDLVVADWALPGLNGLAAFRIVRDLGFDTPFIIVSGTIEEESAVEALKAGANDFMTKGRLPRLLPAIERELREAEGRRQKKLAERELERQRQETERSERLLRSVLQSVPDGVVVVDTSGKVVVWSAGASALFQMDASAVTLAEWPLHYGLYLSDRTNRPAGSELAIARALTGESVDRQELFLRNPGVPKGAWLSVSGRPLRAADGRITGALGVLRDVTKERLAQEQVMISDRMASVGMLAAGVAHEINNPLNAALLNLEVIGHMLAKDKAGRDESELKESLEDARGGLTRVREIVRDLRIFSRHEEQSELRADVRSALESSLRMAFNELRHRAHVTRDYGDVPAVVGSEARLGQVFLNLIVNAAQAIPEGNVDRNEVRVRTRTSGKDRVVIEISDTGAGIRPEDIANLFTPFFTTKPPGIGTGLGLPICRRIAEQLGGSIEVESELGQGTTVRVNLVAAEAPDSSLAAPRMASTAPLSHRRGRILVVDDEPMLAAAIRRVLSRHHDVVTTTRALDALERLRSGIVFDIIFSDLMMPQVTGMELYARICEEFPEQAARVVFLTGGAFTQAAREFLAKVKNPTLEKPIDRHGLLALVSERVGPPSSPSSS